jgi:hypothetical protein
MGRTQDGKRELAPPADDIHPVAFLDLLRSQEADGAQLLPERFQCSIGFQRSPPGPPFFEAITCCRT